MARTDSSATDVDPKSFHLVGDLGSDLVKAERIRTGVGGATLPILVAAVLVSALLVAASGLFWGLRRQRELRLLSSRGVDRIAIGVKAGLEMLPAMAVGGWSGG